MSEIRQTGKTVEDAIASALEKLNTLREQVDVQVITEGKKGFLGFGAVPAEVLVRRIPEEPILSTSSSSDSKEEVDEELAKESASVQVSESEVIVEQTEKKDATGETEATDMFAPTVTDDEIIAETSAYICQIAKDMGVEDLRISSEKHGKILHFQLESEKAAYLIGKRGSTLNALQQLAQLVANKGTGTYKVVRVDVGDYRVRREQALEQLAERMADKAVRSGRKVQLEPMPSNERKVLHHALADRLDIETYSEGKDPRRYLVIEPIV
ncbi:RNA-binding cell elongation regulator Jag/EloR [Sporosarcina gallistercoris]|uniref:RNA-binding protein KhpB n=1 Tax=Sporosarcina gallistercoris TaxID=2762245 RepID=A0ABR8PN23_9BACL|nr:RNA-binding cell elongation regulator Jag/EloR [Sporosarcina gallistercoris]MBD7909563.1 protein jag [Sporosarcina gallistercoris]